MRHGGLATLAVTAGALVVLAGCGSSDAADTTAANTTTASSTAADPYETYTQHLATYGITPGVQRGEAVSVAGNTCDNTVADMAGLLTSTRSLYTADEYDDTLVDRAVFIEAYCPNARPVFDAAMQQVTGRTLPGSVR